MIPIICAAISGISCVIALAALAFSIRTRRRSEALLQRAEDVRDHAVDVTKALDIAVQREARR